MISKGEDKIRTFWLSSNLVLPDILKNSFQKKTPKGISITSPWYVKMMISPRFGECTVHWFPCSESKFQTWDLPFLCFESLYHVSTRFAAKLWISFKNAKLLKSLKILLHLCRFWMSVFDIMIPHNAKEDWIYQILVDICLFHHSNILSIPFAPLHCFLFLFVMIQIIVVCYCEDAVCRVNLMKLIKIWPRFHKPTMPLLLQG